MYHSSQRIDPYFKLLVLVSLVLNSDLNSLTLITTVVYGMKKAI